MDNLTPAVGRPRGNVWRALQAEVIVWEGQVLLPGGEVDLAARLIVTHQRLAFARGGALALEIPREWLRPAPALLPDGEILFSISPIYGSEPDKLKIIVREGRRPAAHLVSLLTGNGVRPVVSGRPSTFDLPRPMPTVGEMALKRMTAEPISTPPSPPPARPASKHVEKWEAAGVLPSISILDMDDFPPIRENGGDAAATPSTDENDFAAPVRALPAALTSGPRRDTSWNLEPITALTSRHTRAGRRNWAIRLSGLVLLLFAITAFVAGGLPDSANHVTDRIPAASGLIGGNNPSPTSAPRTTPTNTPATKAAADSSVSNRAIPTPNKTAEAIGIGGPSMFTINGSETATPQPTNTPVATATDVPTETPTPVPTETATDVPTETPTETPTDVPTETSTTIPTETAIATATEQPTEPPAPVVQEAPTEVPLATDVPTAVPTAVPTEAPPPTETATTPPQPTATVVVAPTSPPPPTAVPSATLTETALATSTVLPTASATSTGTNTPSPTATAKPPSFPPQAPGVGKDETPKQVVDSGQIRYTLTSVVRGAELPELALPVAPWGDWVVLVVDGMNWSDQPTSVVMNDMQLATTKPVDYLSPLDTGTGAIAQYLGLDPAFGSGDQVTFNPGQNQRFALVFTVDPSATNFELWIGATPINLDEALQTANPVFDLGPSPGKPETLTAQVVSVIDGDTLRVSAKGQITTVSYSGIKAPVGNDCYAAEAKLANEQLVSGRTVLLERQRFNTDGHGGLVRDVWAVQEDGSRILVSAELVAEGAATPSIRRPDSRFAGWLAANMDHAATAGAGLWGACGATTTGDDAASGSAALVSFGRSVRGWSGAFWKGDD
jgi:endonuclease YncB( thermonuclease family)